MSKYTQEFHSSSDSDSSNDSDTETETSEEEPTRVPLKNKKLLKKAEKGKKAQLKKAMKAKEKLQKKALKQKGKQKQLAIGDGSNVIFEEDIGDGNHFTLRKISKNNIQLLRMEVSMNSGDVGVNLPMEIATGLGAALKTVKKEGKKFKKKK